jgi:hypothetical protein
MNGSTKLPNIPEKIDDWNTDVLEKLIRIKDIESETFDFKRNVDDKMCNGKLCRRLPSSRNRGGYNEKQYFDRI